MGDVGTRSEACHRVLVVCTSWDFDDEECCAWREVSELVGVECVGFDFAETPDTRGGVFASEWTPVVLDLDSFFPGGSGTEVTGDGFGHVGAGLSEDGPDVGVGAHDSRELFGDAGQVGV